MSDANPLKQLLFADVEHELATTRRVLERVPAERLAWQPHEKSMTLGALAMHIANLVRWQVSIFQADGYDFAANPPPRDPATSRDQLLGAYDAGVADLRAALGEATDESLSRDWTLRRGDHVLFTGPRSFVFRSFGLSHIAHHRGQLTVYLRLLDVSLPPVYGPTADER